MITQDTVLVQLIRLVERIPSPPPSPPCRRGRPIFYSEKLFLKALVIMIVRRLHRVGELLAVLDEPTSEMKMVRELLREEGRFPCRRTFERRLKALPGTLPEQICRLGGHLVGLLRPWERTGRAVALETAPLLEPKRWSVAQERQRSRQGTPHLHRYRGSLDQIGLARVGVWVEAAPGHHGGRDVDSTLCEAHPGRRGGQPHSPVTDRGAAGRGALRFGRHSLRCPERTREMRANGAVFGHFQTRRLPAHRLWGGGEADLSQAA